MSKSAYFISDLHLGAEPRRAHPAREGHLLRFLRETAREASHLFILGDLFEFWMEYRDFIPKAHFGTLAALGRLAEEGVEVHYLGGNHDFNLGAFFRDHLKLTVHEGPMEVELQGRKLLLLHGDGLAASDWKYRMVKKVMVHPLSNRCFKWVHPDLGMALARSLSKLSRDNHQNAPRRMEEYEKSGREMLRRGYDIVMHGHTHAGFVKEFPEGVYVNSGEWLGRLEYVRMRNGLCSLETYGG